MDSALHVWTTAQRDAFIAAYDADQPALSNVALACLLATVPPKEDGDSAVRYVHVAWVSPAPSPDQIKQRLVAKYGAVQGTADFNNWPAVYVAGCARG